MIIEIEFHIRKMRIDTHTYTCLRGSGSIYRQRFSRLHTMNTRNGRYDSYRAVNSFAKLDFFPLEQFRWKTPAIKSKSVTNAPRRRDDPSSDDVERRGNITARDHAANLKCDYRLLARTYQRATELLTLIGAAPTEVSHENDHGECRCLSLM